MVITERVIRKQLEAAGIAVNFRSQSQKRTLIKRGNRELTDTDFVWLLEQDVMSVSAPTEAVRVERLEWGNFYGELHSLLDHDREIARSAEQPEATWTRFQELIDQTAELRRSIQELERDNLGRINYEMERLLRTVGQGAVAGGRIPAATH